MSMTALTLRALSALPAPLAARVRTHAFKDEIDDLVSECFIALATARADDTLDKVFARARSNVRRMTQDVAHYSVSIDEFRAADEIADEQQQSAYRRSDYVRETARVFHVTNRRAQQLVKAQIARAAACGDLFGGEKK